MRRLLLAIALTVAAAFPAFAGNEGGAVTTRIETRPYYGAVVTVENGVRVWRPLPPHDRIIINPDGKASVNIDIDAKKHANREPVQGTPNHERYGNGYSEGYAAGFTEGQARRP